MFNVSTRSLFVAILCLLLVAKSKDNSYLVKNLKTDFLEENQTTFSLKEFLKFKILNERLNDYELLFQNKNLEISSSHKGTIEQLKRTQKALNFFKRQVEVILGSFDKESKEELKLKLIGLKNLFVLGKKDEGFLILDKNKKLEAVIINAGYLQGVQQGDIFVGKNFKLVVAHVGYFLSVAKSLDKKELISIGSKIKRWK